MRSASTLQRSTFVTTRRILALYARVMPEYSLVLERGDGSEPEIVPHYDSEVAFGPGMVLPEREGEIWQVDRTSKGGLTLHCKLIVSA